MISTLAFTQTTFEVTKLGGQYTIEQINNAFASADLCGSYFIGKRNTLVFNDGTEIVLKSKQELIAAGISLPESCFLNDNQEYYSCIWSIAANGFLMKGYDTHQYSNEKEYQQFKNLQEQN